MSGTPELRSLLEDILKETAPEDLQKDLLEQMLSQSRRQKRFRNIAKVAVLFAGVLVLAYCLSLVSQSHDSPPNGFVVVTSQSLSPSSIVETRPGGVAIITSSGNRLQIVESASANPRFELITDEELLAFFSGRPAALIRYHEGHAVLVPLDASDETDHLAE